MAEGGDAEKAAEAAAASTGKEPSMVGAATKRGSERERCARGRGGERGWEKDKIWALIERLGG